MRLWFSIFVVMIAIAASARADGKPQRIVSLNVCVDQLLVELVEPDRIAGVSRLAADPKVSALPGKLSRFKALRGSAEEVLALQPDLVLAGEFTTGATIDLLKRLGKTIVTVPLASDFDAMRAGIRQIASAVGEDEKGEAMIAEFDERLSAARSTIRSRPTAIAYEANSLVSGSHTLMDAALDAAGYRNLARDLKLGPGGRLPLEMLVAAPPDLIVLANAPDDYRTAAADNLRHPALMRVLQSRPSIVLPAPYWICATPKIADAVELLAAKKKTSFAAAERAR